MPRVRNELRVAAYAVCIRADELLLARFTGFGRRVWTLPGGGVEHGEQPHDAVVREVAEETGHVAEVERLLGVYSRRRTYSRGYAGVVDHQTIRIIYAATVVGGELRHEIGGSTDQAMWMPLDRLAELDGERDDLVDTGLALHRDRPPAGHL